MAADAFAKSFGRYQVETSEFILPSFAKINWNLRVLGKRPDDYHEVVTILQMVSLHDDLAFTARPDDQLLLTCTDPDIPTDEKNLILRAAFALRSSFASNLGANINLVKRIPVKGGLGGASSNAAAALLGLSRLWRMEVTLSNVRKIGGDLGADVPFFFIGGRALGEGIGTNVSPLPDRLTQRLIIVSPNATVSTRAAYSALDASSLTSATSVSILASSSAEPVLSDCDQWPLHNDFEAVIFEIEPEIKRAREALLEAGARGALMAGSGSSVFGIFSTEEARLRALENLRSETGWRIFSCDTLSRNEYFQAMGSCDTSALTLF